MANSRQAWMLVLMVSGLVLGYVFGYQITYEMQIRSYDVYLGDTLLFPGELYVAEEGLEGIVRSKAISGGMTWALILGGVGFVFGFLIPLRSQANNTTSSLKGWAIRCPNCKAMKILNSNDLPSRITCGICDETFIPDTLERVSRMS